MKYSIENLTIDEKIRLLCGTDMWHTYDANGKLRVLQLCDGPNGLRKVVDDKTVKATAMPNIHVLANSWNKETARLSGETIADDCADNNVDILLAPGVNVKRTPLCGRNFEYFSEDPFLAGELGKAYIEGVQSRKIGTSLKHFMGNNAEYERLSQTSEIDERTMREIYLPAFEKALEAKPYTVMCSYNPVNGVFASENKVLLDDILRKEFGFDGLIMSDWGAVKSPYKSVKATLDLCMPYDENHFNSVKAAYEKGIVTEEEIDACVKRILELIEKCPTEKHSETTKEQRHKNAVEIAKDGIVLLKNEGALPLKSGKILFSNYMTVEPEIGGGGSALVETDFAQAPLDKLVKDILGDKVETLYSDDFANSVNGACKTKLTYLNAYGSDAVVITIGNDRRTEGEGFDRERIRLAPVQENLIINTAKYNDNVIVALYAGSAIDMSAWIDCVNAVVLVGFAGEGANEALAEILTGKTCPSGKLCETFPLTIDDLPVEENDGMPNLRYNEGIYVGYRYYDTFGVPVLFPFGHGLSYAEFEYSDLSVTKTGDAEYEVAYTIENLSDIDAKEVSEVYVKDVIAMVSRPEKELKGFSKDLIPAHGKKRVTVKLDYRSFAYYCTALKRWQVENGDFEILVGASSSDIRLKAKTAVSLPDETQQSQI
ncbi:MAG: glycoside hydrolase family 3 C-terminal domain-containing protein [Clostridia bacterium]|nr:glycoside hydrolase family 3 C-terminal domain-containing protein [Clostridia bacterium]